uniref:Secreted protein n=1 Tax=Panagrolaimus sp. JU765 TaxID=591449 RepID=A0AC34R8L0_9BILA
MLGNFSIFLDFFSSLIFFFEINRLQNLLDIANQENHDESAHWYHIRPRRRHLNSTVFVRVKFLPWLLSSDHVAKLRLRCLPQL